MARLQCVPEMLSLLLLAVALPVCLEAMLLLSPPVDKESVEWDTRQMKTTTADGEYSSAHGRPILGSLEDPQAVMSYKEQEARWAQTRTHDSFVMGTDPSSYHLQVIDEQDYAPIEDSDSIIERALDEEPDSGSHDERSAVGHEDGSFKGRRRNVSQKQARRYNGLVSDEELHDIDAAPDQDSKTVFRRFRRSTRRRPKAASRADPTRTRTKSQRRRDGRGRRARIGGRRRGQVVRAQVELLVVVENSIFRKFMANNFNNRRAAEARLRNYYSIVVAMMDQRFQTIQDRRLSISVTLSDIVIAKTREESLWLEKLVDWSSKATDGKASVSADKALRDFGKWVKANHKTLPKFDHAMVFTGYTLTSKYFGFPYGKAYLGAVCERESGGAVSIVADSSDFQCVKVATHELAHSLGSVHDGDPGFEHCPYDSNYIMSRVSTIDYDRLKNSFYFSSCSIKQMKKHLKTKGAKCVRDTPTSVAYKYDLHRKPPGLITSPDQHCQMIYGPKATFCPEVKTNICGQLWCRESTEKSQGCRTNSYCTALPGTPCGPDQTCHLGECMNSTTVQKMVRDTQRRLQQKLSHHHRWQRPPHPTPTSSASSSTSSSRSQPPSRRDDVVPGSSQSRLTGGQRAEGNIIPTLPRTEIRGRIGRGPGSSSRVARRLQQLKAREARRRRKALRQQRRRQQRQQKQQQKPQQPQQQQPGRSRRPRPRPRPRIRRKGRCKANQPDTNVKYCRGLVQLNPGACKRRDIYAYCCRTCAFRR